MSQEMRMKEMPGTWVVNIYAGRSLAQRYRGCQNVETSEDRMILQFRDASGAIHFTNLQYSLEAEQG